MTLEKIEEEIIAKTNIVDKMTREIEFYGWDKFSENYQKYFIKQCAILNSLNQNLSNEI
jgi:hypothetical protein